MDGKDREFMDGVLHGFALAIHDVQGTGQKAAERVLRARRRQIERIHARDLEQFILEHSQ